MELLDRLDDRGNGLSECVKLTTEVLTEEERGKLLELADMVEMQDAERARAMFELATLRGVDLMVIVQEFRVGDRGELIYLLNTFLSLREHRTLILRRPPRCPRLIRRRCLVWLCHFSLLPSRQFRFGEFPRGVAGLLGSVG